MGKDHNAASSLVEIPRVRKLPQPSQPASQPRHEPDALPKLQQRVDVFFTTPLRCGPPSGPTVPTKESPPSPLRQCQLTDRHLLPNLRPRLCCFLFSVLSSVASASVVFIERAASGPTCISFFPCCLLLAFCNSPERSCHGDAGIFSLLDSQADRQTC